MGVCLHHDSCRTEGNKLPPGCAAVFHKHVCRGRQNQSIMRSGALKAVQRAEQRMRCSPEWLHLPSQLILVAQNDFSKPTQSHKKSGLVFLDYFCSFHRRFCFLIIRESRTFLGKVRYIRAKDTR